MIKDYWYKGSLREWRDKRKQRKSLELKLKNLAYAVWSSGVSVQDANLTFENMQQAMRFGTTTFCGIPPNPEYNPEPTVIESEEIKDDIDYDYDYDYDYVYE